MGDNQQQQEVFRGHVEDCLHHFAKAYHEKFPSNSKGSGQKKSLFANFCGVNGATISRWLSSETELPTGANLIRLMVYLDLMGYKVIELENMTVSQRGFAELIGLQVVTPPEAGALANLPENQFNVVYQIILGTRGMTKERESKMWEEWKKRKDLIAQQKSKLRQQYDLGIFSQTKPPQTRPKEEDVPIKEEHPHLETPIKSHAATISIMEGLLAMLENNSQEILDAQLANLGATSINKILKLTAHLNNISSALIMRNQQKGGDGG